MLNSSFPTLLASIRRAQRRPLRTILTVFEVALGALAVTVALNLVQARQTVNAVSDVFRAVAGSRDPVTGGVVTFGLFNRDDLSKVLKTVPNVVAAEIEHRGHNVFLNIRGERFRVVTASVTGPNYERITPLEFTQGGFFTESDLKGGSNPILISQTVADTAFAESSSASQLIGRVIGVERTEMDNALPAAVSHQIVGVYSTQIEPTNGVPGPQIILPPSSSTRFGGKFSTVVAKAAPGRLELAREQLRTALLKEYKGRVSLGGAKDAIFTTLSDDPFAFDSGAMDPQTLIFTGFAVIMLIACSIGIFSICLVDIAERTREIGMRRALGASRGRIVGEIILDALLLSGLGALIGVIAAWPLLAVISRAAGNMLFSSGVVFSPLVAAQVVGIVLTVGGLLGLYPALLASSLRPVDALREV